MTRCLRSLWLERHISEAAGIDLRIVVVDNNSGDAVPLGKLVEEEKAGGYTHIVRAERKGGFAYGNNVATRFAYSSGTVPDCFWFLNPDTEVLPRSSVELVEFMRARPSGGVAGSSPAFEDGVAWPYAFRFCTPLSEIDTGLKLGVVSKLLSNQVVLRKMGEQPEAVDWLLDASMMVRRELVEAIGGMAEEYFLSYEETAPIFRRNRGIVRARSFHPGASATASARSSIQRCPTLRGGPPCPGSL